MRFLRFLPIALLAFAVGLLGLVASSDAQTLLFTLDAPNPQAYLEFAAIVAVGDVNGDGKGDIAAAEWREDVGGNVDQGRAYVFSGADGSLLLTLDSPNPQANGTFGGWIATGDVNGDGKEDIAVAAHKEDLGGNANQGRVYVFSGADGSLLFTLDTPNAQAYDGFGGRMAVGDMNGDGKADVAVGAHREDVGGNADQGRAYVFSGADGSLLFTLDTPNPIADAQFGLGVRVGDVNGDGKGEIAVGATREDVGGNADQGRAYVFSGADGSLLFTLDTPNPQAYARFGVSVAVGEASGDAKGDIAVGARFEHVGGNADQGRAYVFSGADGSHLFTLDSPNPQTGAEFGGWVAAGDVNGDGKADIAVGAHLEDVGGNANQGRAYVFSLAPSEMTVDIDIKPGSDPNSVNLGGNGVIPVAILTTDSFDASTVDPLSVTLDGGAVRLKGKSGNAGALEDVDGDGDLDLIVQIVDWSLSEGSAEAVLQGQTYDGTPIRGTDTVNIVP